MMIKYRVHEVAKDLNVPNKEVLDVLQKYCEETKKHMTALTEEELDLVFESFTQSHSLPSLDAYFADNQEAGTETEVAKAPAAKKAQAPATPAGNSESNAIPGKKEGKETGGRARENQGQARSQNQGEGRREYYERRKRPAGFKGAEAPAESGFSCPAGNSECAAPYGSDQRGGGFSSPPGKDCGYPRLPCGTG